MAQRYGGKFSPEGGAQVSTRSMAPMRHRLASRPKWVTIAATPFLLGAFLQSPQGMVTDLAAFGLIALGMWMTGEGLKAEAAYDIRSVARRPAIPRKLFGGVLTALGLGLGAAQPGVWAGAALIGLAGLALHWLAFGLDPMRDKGITESDDFQLQRAERLIDEAQNYLDQMSQAIARLGDRQSAGAGDPLSGRRARAVRSSAPRPGQPVRRAPLSGGLSDGGARRDDQICGSVCAIAGRAGACSV